LGLLSGRIWINEVCILYVFSVLLRLLPSHHGCNHRLSHPRSNTYYPKYIQSKWLAQSPSQTPANANNEKWKKKRLADAMSTSSAPSSLVGKCNMLCHARVVADSFAEERLAMQQVRGVWTDSPSMQIRGYRVVVVIQRSRQGVLEKLCSMQHRIMQIIVRRTSNNAKSSYV